ncbi:MAG: TolC family protein, partial [Bdellovibrionales bacterium]|nr:TolC family protein [Bdellovibrionales bacterium]
APAQESEVASAIYADPSDSNSGVEVVTLEEALTTALSYNAAIREAEQRVNEQHGVLIYARSFLFPKVEASGRFDAEDQDLIPSFGQSSFGSDKTWDAKLEIRQPLYTGSRGFNYYREQKLREEAARAELEAIAQDVIYQVTQSFFDVLLARSQMEVQRESVRLLEEELRNERNKFAAGTISEFNVLRAEVAVANARTPLIRAENALKLAKEELKRILGAAPQHPQRLREEVDVKGELSSPPFQVVLDDALEQAEARRPELRQLNLLIDAAERGVAVEWGAYLPELSGTASYGIEKSRFSDELDDTLNGWRAGLEVTWDVWDTFETKSLVDQAKARLARARIAHRQRKLDVEVEVRRAYSRLLEAKALLRASEKVVQQADESLRLARNRFNAGAGTQLDVLDAQVALTEAKSNRVQALYDYNLSIARMQRAQGIIDSPHASAKEAESPS